MANHQDLHQFKQGERQLYAVRLISEALFQHTNIENVVRQTLQTALHVIGADAGSVLLLDATAKELIFRYVIGEKADLLIGTAIPSTLGIAGAVLASGKPELITSVKDDARHSATIDAFTGYETQGMIALPLKRWNGDPIGVLEVLNKREGSFAREDCDVLTIVSALAAAAIEQMGTLDSLRQHEIRVQEAQKMEVVGQLTGGIAHDFNNLVTIIVGYTQLVLRRVDEQDAMRQDLEQIHQAGERAATLTKQLLAFSRRQVREVTVLDLNAVIDNLTAMVQQLLGEDIQVVTALDPSLGSVKVNRGEMEQVIVNLAANARDAMP